MPNAAAQLPQSRYDDVAATARSHGWTTQAPPRRNTWSCCCGFVTNFGVRTTCHKCDRPRPRSTTFGNVALVTKGKGKGGPSQLTRRAPWATTPRLAPWIPTHPAPSPAAARAAPSALRASFSPGRNSSLAPNNPGLQATTADVEEEEAARRAAAPPLAALRHIEARIENLTRRETKLASAAARLHAEINSTELDLATTRTQLAAATSERSAAAACVAIPSAQDNAHLQTVAHSSIQTLFRFSEIAGHGANATALRERLQRSAELIRILADEAAAATAAAPAAQSAASPSDMFIVYLGDQAMELEEEAEEDIRATQSLLQT